MSPANQRRGTRRGPTSTNQTKEETTSLSQTQVERLELELLKFPSPSSYYKKKIATTVSKELKITQKLIMQWLNAREKQDSDAAMVNIKSPIVVKKEMVAPVVAKVVQKTPAKSDTDEEIEIIDLDDDDEVETLLNESTDTSKSASLVEASSKQKKVENIQEDSKTFVRTVKVKSKACASVTNTNKPNLEALKLKISELESKTAELENQKRDLAIHSKQKYDNLLNEYKNNLENKIGPMIESYKSDLTKKDNEIAELKESQTKLTTSDKQEKDLLKKLKDKDQKINLVEQKLKTTEATLKKEKEERLKSLKEMKNSQNLLKSKQEEELAKKAEELEKVTKKSLKLKEKYEKSKEEFDKKSPMQEKEITELKEAHDKLKKELGQKEKELQLEAKEVQKLSKLEEEKKSLSKKISKLETESLQKTKSLDAFKLKITNLEKDLKSKSSDLENKQKVFEEQNKQIEERVTELCSVLSEKEADLSRKEELLKEIQQREESLEGKSVEAKTKLTEVKSKLKEKNIVLRKELEEKNSSLAAMKKEVTALKKDRDEKTEEISAKAKTISQCKTDLENAKNVINTTIAELKKTIDGKDQEISGLEAEIQRKVSVFNEKLEAKSVELRDKDTEIESMSKKFSESTELTEKIKEKQLNIIKLSHTVYEKDSLIAKKEEEIQKLAARILELGRETERKLEKRSFQEINNQNKLRHELLLQQQEMRKCLEAEIEANRLQVEEEKLQADKRVEAARAEVEQEAAGERFVLLQRLEERKRLLCKVKMVLLYKPSLVVGREKGSQTSGAKLRLPYNWPLVQQPEFYLTEALQTLLSRPSFPLLKVPSLARPNLKRKAEAEAVTEGSKRRRVSEICWPVVVYQARSLKRKTEQATEIVKKFRLEVTVAPLQNSLSLHTRLPPTLLMSSPQPQEAAPMLMLTYEKPSPSPFTEKEKEKEEKKEEKEEEDDIGLIDIQCYNYKVTRPSVRSRQTAGLISPSEKVTARRYRKPSFTPVTGRGKKRSFLEFLESLSSEEMGDYSQQMTDVEFALLDLKVKISPPAKKHRYSRGVVTARTFPRNMKQMDFYFDFDDSHNICQTMVNILLDSVVH